MLSDFDSCQFGGLDNFGAFVADDLTRSEEVEMMPGVDFLRVRRN